MGASAASAFTLGDARAAAPHQSLIQNVHGCHRDVQEGRYGWHYHRGYDCDRVAVGHPRRHYREDRYEPRYRPGPRCYKECKYVGPIKVCEDRCR